MSQLSESHISDQDSQLIRTHHLGRYQNVYRMSPRYFLFECVSGFFIAMVAVDSSIWMPVTANTMNWSFYLLFYIGSLFAFFMLIIFVLTTVPDARNYASLFAKQIYFQVKSVSGYSFICMMHWTNIQTIQQWFSEYHVKDGRGKPLVISAFIYHNGDELLAFSSMVSAYLLRRPIISPVIWYFHPPFR